MSENSLRSVLADVLSFIDDEQAAYPSNTRTWETFRELRERVAALAATQEPQRDLTPRECFETYRNLVWSEQEADGMNRGWTEFARRLNEIMRYRAAGAPAASGRDELENLIRTARALARAAHQVLSLEQVPSNIIHDFYAAVRDYDRVIPSPEALKAAAPRPDLAALHAKAQEVARLVTRSDADAATVENTLFTAFVDVMTEREAPPDLASALERLVAKWREPMNHPGTEHSAYVHCADELAAQLKVQR